MTKKKEEKLHHKKEDAESAPLKNTNTKNTENSKPISEKKPEPPQKNITEEEAEERFPKSSVIKQGTKIRVYLPDAGWSPGLCRSFTSGFHFIEEKDLDKMKHLVGEYNPKDGFDK